ncbi:MAG: hypothetical protein KBB29_00375 [Bacteroidales bacterium]|nr:hypothetical protein [Bacteroidales bacterium]HOA09009.1 hypothetical protein [Tenuifilaceae bacterium]HOC35872.1 hypothetical protein [Tenuifilaceae bacterium]
MFRRFCLLVVSFLFIYVKSGFPQPQETEPSITSRLQRDTILIGDQITFSIEVKSIKPLRVVFPNFTDSLGNGVEVVGIPTVDSLAKANYHHYSMDMLITAFDSGTLVVPSIPVVLASGHTTDTLFTQPHALHVNLVPRDTTLKEIYDIKPPIAEPLTFAEVAPLVGSGLLLAALVVLLVLYVRSRKQNKPFLNLFKPKEPPHLVALRELEQLRNEKLWANENHKLFYTRLVDILRKYMEGRFGINAPEQTTSEILSELERIEYDFGHLKEELRELLVISDLVKFAKHVPLIQENEKNMNFAFDFVNSTRPVETPEIPATTDDTGQQLQDAQSENQTTNKLS